MVQKVLYVFIKLFDLTQTFMNSQIIIFDILFSIMNTEKFVAGNRIFLNFLDVVLA